MSKLPVTIDYVKIAQWAKMIKYYEQKILDELDQAAIEAGHINYDRRNGERRNGNNMD